jgi:glycosyltransferase involved in cell wall biosynthesis
MPNKTILVVTDNLRDQVNGVQTTFKSIEDLARSDGYNIVYIDPGQFPHINCPGYPEVKLSWPRSMGQKIKALDPDYVHIATEGPLGFAARCWLDKKRYRYNTSYHTNFPEFIKKIYGIPESYTYRYVKWFHKHSGKVLTTTKTMVLALERKGFQANIVAWTRGVDRSYLKPSYSWNPALLGRPKPTVLYVGRVSKEKNLDDLCCLQDRYNIQIVGDGPDRKRLEKTFKDVKFLGYKTGVELADYYAKADVFGFPSRTDTFGIVIIEAMSLGTPVAAYFVQGPSDIIEHGINGYMGFNLAENIEKCLTLDRQRVKQSSEKWTWENCWKIFKENLVEKES